MSLRRATLTRAALFLPLLLAAAAPAVAHTPYLLPNAFDPERPRVTLQGALTEDDYFNPDIALSVQNYVETQPSGQQVQIAPNVVLKDVAVIEAPLDAAGTYRFSTGASVGRKATFAKIGDKWLMVRQPRPPRPGGEGGPPGGAPRPGGEEGPPGIAEADVPADAPRMQTEGIMTAETYVSKGAPTQAALKATGQGFELKPQTHPNAVYLDQGFAFQLTVDGAPAGVVPISVYRSGNIYDDRRIAVELKTDAQGRATVHFQQPGVYLLTTHYPAAMTAPGAAPPARNYTYSLTFEVTR